MLKAYFESLEHTKAAPPKKHPKSQQPPTKALAVESRVE